MFSRVNNPNLSDVIRARPRAALRCCAIVRAAGAAILAALALLVATPVAATPGGPTLGASARLVRPHDQGHHSVTAGSPTGSTVEYILITPDVRPPPVAPAPARVPMTPLPTQVTPPPRRQASAATLPPSASAPATRPPAQRFAPQSRGRQLGDGSVEGELLAAAQRLVGRSIGAERTLLGHLAQVAGVALGLGADPAHHVADALATLSTRGKTFRDTRPAPGDLGFLRLDGALVATVVEGTDAAGRVHLVADRAGRVARVVLRSAKDRRVHRWARP